MAYKLSSHLAAMRLNVEAGFVNGNRIYAPFGGTVNQLMALANNSLRAIRSRQPDILNAPTRSS